METGRWEAAMSHFEYALEPYMVHANVMAPQVHIWAGQSPAVKLDTMVDLNVSSVRLHPDGRQIAFQVTAAAKPAEFWVTENFLSTTKK